MDPIFFLAACGIVLFIFVGFVAGVGVGMIINVEWLGSFILTQIEGFRRPQLPPPIVPVIARDRRHVIYDDLPAIPVPRDWSEARRLPTVRRPDVTQAEDVAPVDAEQRMRDLNARCARDEDILFRLMQGNGWGQARKLLTEVRTTRLPHFLRQQDQVWEQHPINFTDVYELLRRAVNAHLAVYDQIREVHSRDHALPMDVRVVNVIATLQALEREYPMSANWWEAGRARQLPSSFEEAETRLAGPVRPDATVRSVVDGPSSLNVRPRPELPEMTVRQRKREDSP